MGLNIASSLLGYGSNAASAAGTPALAGASFLGQSTSTPSSSSSTIQKLQSLANLTKFNNPLTTSKTRLATTNLRTPSAAVKATKTFNGEVFRDDLRVRIGLLKGTQELFYRDQTNVLLSPLNDTDGFIFPIQPQIITSFNASYDSTQLTHSNFNFYNYKNSEIGQFNITGDIIVRNQIDGQYVLAGITFLRSLTRMFNIKDSINFVGYPPVLACLYGAGYGGFDGFSIGITSVTVTYPDGVDYISIVGNFDTKLEISKIPVNFQLSVTAVPVYSRKYATEVYSTIGFSEGKVRLSPNRDI